MLCPPLPPQLMRNLGALEAMFTSDGQYKIAEGLKMKPSVDTIHTLNYQTAHENPLQRLKVKVVSLSCFCSLFSTNILCYSFNMYMYMTCIYIYIYMYL